MKKHPNAAHYFRRFRQHQAAVAVSGGGMKTVYPTGRVELSYGSAPYGEHALSAWIAANRHAHFMDRMRTRQL